MMVRLSFTASAYARLRRMGSLIGAVTDREVISNALRLFEWYLLAKADGYKLARTKDGQTFTVVDLDFSTKDGAESDATSLPLTAEERALLDKVPAWGLQDIRLGPKQRRVAESLVTKGVLRKDGITYFPRVAS